MAEGTAEIFKRGTQIIAPLLERHSFARENSVFGRSSGGDFASATWARGPRRLELHFRNSLGLVRYHAGEESISHEDYMWAVTGRRWATEYPGFSADPLDGFRHLRADLEDYALVFLDGSDAELSALLCKAMALRETAPRLPD